MDPLRNAMLHLLSTAAVLAFLPVHAQEYRSSVVGTDFDFITEADPSVFERLDFAGEALAEMPDKTSSAPLRQQAFVFDASFGDGTRVRIYVDADFESEETAREEALRYAPRLGRLPTALRQGVERLVVHRGGEDATAFSDVGLIALYSENATKRISTHDLEETLFHESVHAAWDARHARSEAWRAAQSSDGAFVTNYARDNEEGEDLAESALFAYALLHHPERIPEPDAGRIRSTIPARIAFVATLLPPGEPITYAIQASERRSVDAIEPEERGLDGPRECRLDPAHLATAAGISDIVSNALNIGLEQHEPDVHAFLAQAKREFSTADELIAAAARRFELEERALHAAVADFLHCNCEHVGSGAYDGEPASAAGERDRGSAASAGIASPPPSDLEDGALQLVPLLLVALVLVNLGILATLLRQSRTLRTLAAR